MSDSPVIAIVVAIVVALIAAVSGYLGIRASSKASKDTTELSLLVNGLQTELAATRAEVAAHDARIKALEGENRELLDYAHELRDHIDQRKPPPPPEWPTGLKR